MPRPLGEAVGGMLFHVLNRAAGRSRIFSKEADYLAFEFRKGDITGSVSTLTFPDFPFDNAT